MKNPNSFHKYPFVASLFLLLAIVNPLKISSQGSKKMTPSVYSEWNRLKNVKISDSAQIITYTLDKEVGDKQLLIFDRAKNTSHHFDRVVKHMQDPNGEYVVIAHGLSYDSIRTLKRKKTPKDKMPSDSLTIFNIKTLVKSTIADVKDFNIPAKYTGYVAYTIKEKNNETKDSLKLIETKKKSVCENYYLIVRNLRSGENDTIKYIKDFIMAEKEPYMLYSVCHGDTIASFDVYIKNLLTSETTLVTENKTEVTNLSLDQNGKQWAFLTTDQKSDKAQKPYRLYAGNQNAPVAVDISEKFIVPEGHIISSNQKLTWTESGKRLFFGIAPLLPERDTTKLEDEIVNVEIWHHDSPRLYTQMEASIENDRKKTYGVMYDAESTDFHQYEDVEFDKSVQSVKGDGRYFVLLHSTSYQKAVTWEGELLKDMYLYDTALKNKVKIGTAESGNPAFSAGGRYLYWWSRQDSIWKTYDTQTSALGYLGLWSISRFYDEEHDTPSLAEGYGIAGWLKNDSIALVYDRYDIYKIDPKDAFNYTNLTNGRASKTIHRVIQPDPDIRYIDQNVPVLLHHHNEDTREESYSWLDLTSGQITKSLGGAISLTKNVLKAAKEDTYIFTQENFHTFPDILLSNRDFSLHKKISDANPQQINYGWGTAKLISWKNLRGQKNNGMLFFPPGFDPEKKYPLIVNFYEKSSEGIYKHRAPEANRSTINYTYYTNQGFVIFNPDIKYLTGQPGEDCFNAVESGVDELLKKGYIDESRMALQGHSWGGYQIAYLLTKTGRYKCAESGAPVVNMVSAYGGIRWESGMSRMFQYEKSQSRLGVSLWDNVGLYHKNSPIYEMTNVTTPVLIMHNDEDGAVPWYQGIEYYMALRRLGKPAWLLNYNGEPHWPVKWQNRLDFNIRLEQFFKYYLMDSPLPMWMKEGNTPLEKGILDKY